MTPKFFDAAKCGTMFKPDCDAAFLEGSEYATAQGVTASALDSQQRMVLCLIDMQVDFINPDTSNYPGNLAVPGATGDVARICQFIFDNADKISHIVASLDTHYLYQPFHRFNWQAGQSPADGYQTGDYPNPFTVITLADIEGGVWQPVRMPKRMREMIRRLEDGSKKNLCIWPLHCELGTPGQALDPMLMQAIHWHSGVRCDQYDLTSKGMSQSAEHYGILKAEVEFPDDVLTTLRMDIVNKWAQADRIYFAGEARTHCVLETLNQVADVFSKNSPEVLNKLYVLDDCMSNVPDIEDGQGNTIVPFDQITTDRFAELARMGFKFVKSTNPIDVSAAASPAPAPAPARATS